jgi:hypothetical protein
MCGFVVIKNTVKKTKKGKDYLLLSVRCLVSDSKHSIFIWSLGVNFEENMIYKIKLKKSGDFISLSY